MANLDFYAGRDDNISLLEFLWSQTDVRVYPLASYEELVDYPTIDALKQRHPHLLEDGDRVFLQLWSSSVTDAVEIKRTEILPAYSNGHPVQYHLHGAGLIQLYLGRVTNEVITHTHFGHSSQKRAAAWNIDEGVDWAELTKLSNKIQYHIRNRLAVAKISARPILPQALDLVHQGYVLEDYSGDMWQHGEMWRHIVHKPTRKMKIQGVADDNR